MLNVVQTIILITPPPPPRPPYVSVSNICNGRAGTRGNLNVHTLRCSLLRAGPRCRRLYFVKIQNVFHPGALAPIKFRHKLNYSFTGEFIEVRTYKKYLYFVPSFDPGSGERITPSEQSSALCRGGHSRL